MDNTEEKTPVVVAHEKGEAVKQLPGESKNAAKAREKAERLEREKAEKAAKKAAEAALKGEKAQTKKVDDEELDPTAYFENRSR